MVLVLAVMSRSQRTLAVAVAVAAYDNRNGFRNKFKRHPFIENRHTQYTAHIAHTG